MIRYGGHGKTGLCGGSFPTLCKGRGRGEVGKGEVAAGHCHESYLYIYTYRTRRPPLVMSSIMYNRN